MYIAGLSWLGMSNTVLLCTYRFQPSQEPEKAFP
jgi:hypothetical protein